jgi:HK97 gp10 family phage protein
MANTAKQINLKLRRMVNEQKKAVDLVLFNEAQAMVSDVKSSFPKSTGRTADEYDILEKRGKKYSFIDGSNPFFKILFKRRDYIAFLQEFGTVRMPPQPTIRPAWSRHVNKIKNAAISAGKEIITKYR